MLIHCPVGRRPRPDCPEYEAIRAAPPQGCRVEEFGAYCGLVCERRGATLLDAVAGVCAEIRTGHGLLMTDPGIEKLWEWSSDGTDGWGADVVGQLLRMAAEQGPERGYKIEDLVRFLRTAAGPSQGGRSLPRW
ncbi:amidase [Streptomyces sp. NPDC016469]|uniref:amidase n=1 Tax=Streptomyces sp. NPDC016469 TaxID=3157191 RepID=UPI0033DB791B